MKNSVAAVLFKQLVVDPLKVICCGTVMHDAADIHLTDFDLTANIGEHMDDGSSVEEGTSHDAMKGAEEGGARKDMHENVFLVGSRSVVKMKGIAQRGQVCSIRALELDVQMANRMWMWWIEYLVWLIACR